MRFRISEWSSAILALILCASMAFAGLPTVGVQNRVIRSGDTMTGTLSNSVASGTNGFACTTDGCRFDFGTGSLDYMVSNGTDIRAAGSLALGNAGDGDLAGLDTTTEFIISSATPDSVTSGTVGASFGAFRFQATANLTDSDSIITIDNSVGTNIFEFSEDGRFRLRGGLVVSLATASTFTISSDTSDATTSTTVAAVTIAANTDITAGDLVLEVNDSTNASLLTIDEQGLVVVTSDVNLAGNDLRGTGTAQTFNITSATADTTTSATVAAITLAPTVNVTDGDLVLEVNDSTAASLFTIDEEGDVVATGDIDLAGNDFRGTGTAQTFNITSATADTTTSATVAAITLAPTVAITSGDLVLEVNRSDGTAMLALDTTSLFTVAIVDATTEASGYRLDGQATLFYETTNVDTMRLRSNASAANTTSTTGAIRLHIANAVDANDLLLNIIDGASANRFSVDAEGDVAIIGDATIAGNDLRGTGTAQTFNITSATADTTTSTTIAAITLAPTVNVTDGDLVLEVNDSAAASLFTIDEQGLVVVTSDVNLAGNDLRGTGTAQTFNITSATADTTTSATVAAITLANTAALTGGDLTLEVNDSGGTSLLSLEAEGDLYLRGTAAATPFRMTQRLVVANTSDTAFTIIGIAAPSVVGTPTASPAPTGGTRKYIQYATAATNNDPAGIKGAYNTTRPLYRPKFSTTVLTDDAITLRRIWAGVAESALDLVAHTTTAAASTVDYIAIGFDTSVSANWLCCSGDGTNHVCASAEVAVAANTEYRLSADWTTSGTLLCCVNNTCVSKTSNLSTAAVDLGIQNTITTLDASVRNHRISMMILEQN